MNLIQAIQKESSKEINSKGALAFNTTLDKVLDYFSLGGTSGSEESLELFKGAFLENPELALKCMFYLRDIRSGQGLRENFRYALNFLAQNSPETLKGKLHLVPEFGRWDDLYSLVGTPLENESKGVIKEDFEKDLKSLKASNSVSLLGKWLKSENASSLETKKLGRWTRKALGLTPKEYRLSLTKLRKALNVVEVPMSSGDFDSIDFSAVPSKAMLKYRSAFHRNTDKFLEYIQSVKDGAQKINARTLYPHEIVTKLQFSTPDETKVLEALWENLPSFEGDVLCMVDVSGSMTGLPMEVAISLGLYVSERSSAFKNTFLTFSETPELVTLPEGSLSTKVRFMRRCNWGYNTDITKAFKLILDSAVKHNISQEEMPERLIVFSDMEFDEACSWDDSTYSLIRKMFTDYGYEMPALVFWNLRSYGRIPVQKDFLGVKTLSGFSVNLMESVLKDDYMTPLEYMLSILKSERYSEI